MILRSSAADPEVKLYCRVVNMRTPHVGGLARARGWPLTAWPTGSALPYVGPKMRPTPVRRKEKSAHGHADRPIGGRLACAPRTPYRVGEPEEY